MTLSEELQWRGFIQQTTFKEIVELDDQIRTFYHGFDASADSQTIGNLAAMMFDKVFIRHGWKAILLAGGATSLIGDPGGKDKERPMQTEETIAYNVARAEDQLKKIIGEQNFTLVNNLDWTRDMTVLNFLRDIGKHFSMTPLVQRDYIAQRIGEGGAGISYTEFSYTLLQGMDYLHLFDTYNVTVQLGGSDQWGNCLSGVELIRKARGAEAHVITIPLIINQATGRKFGKSEEGAVWLDAQKTSIYKFYQFWINIDDKGIEYYLKIYTELDKHEIENIVTEHGKDPGRRIAQKRLAQEVTTIVHGKEATDKIVKITEGLFTNDFHDWTAEDFAQIEGEVPYAQLPEKTNYVDALLATGLCKSKTEARRLITEGGIRVNSNIHAVSGEDAGLEGGDSIDGYIVLVKGKKHKALVKLV